MYSAMLKINYRLMHWAKEEVERANYEKGQHIEGFLQALRPSNSFDEPHDPLNMDRRDDATEAMIDRGEL